MTLIEEAEALIASIKTLTKAKKMMIRLVAQIKADATNLALADTLVTADIEWPAYYRNFYGCAHCEGLRPGQSADPAVEQIGHSPSCPRQSFRAARGMA
jgi:hypothetical protein